MTSNLMWKSLNYATLILFVLMCIYPFYYIAIYSISVPNEAVRGITVLPAGFTLDNYSEIFKLKNISNSFVVSVLRTVIGTAITLWACSFFSYIIAKREMYFRKIVYRFVIITMYLNAGLIPWYLTMKMYGLKNSFLLYIIPSAMSAFYIILIKTFIEQLPEALEESAMLDGAGYNAIFYKIILPLSKPILATIAVFAAVGQWNSWMDNFFLVTNSDLQTLQLTLYKYLIEAQSIANMSASDISSKSNARQVITPEAVRMTITIVATFPILLVYPFMQRYFVKGIMMGSIKG